MLNRATKWLETKWATPAYAGWLLAILTICFFGAATNTMAGWLYVLSGVGVALLGVGAVLPARSIRSLTVSREPILPVTAGDELEIVLTVGNPTGRVQSLFQVRDLNVLTRSHPPQTTVEQILPQTEHRWVYRQPTEQRGVYQWSQVALRSGAPIGLFWSERSRRVPAIAYVYPQVLELAKCPLIDGMGSQERQTERANRQLDADDRGITRSLRPYRYGDPMRSIHWRTSARYGEFQVRELEIDRGGQEVVIFLDSGANWNAADFEQAVIAACTLYFYAHQRFDVQLWTAGTGLIAGERQVLETLAAVQLAEPQSAELPTIPSICLTSQPQQLTTLVPGSRWILWTDDSPGERLRQRFTHPSGAPGIAIDRDRSLQQQLSTNEFASKPVAPRATPIPLKIQTHDLN